MNAPKTGRKRERGVALMMTLGVLALLMILAMSFAYSTKTEALAASVNADMIRARLLAESGMDRAVGFLREQFRTHPYPGGRFYLPAAGDWNTRGGCYMASVNTDAGDEIETALSSMLELGSGNWLYYTPEAQLHPSVGWIPIIAKEDPASATSPESCVGLVSYLIIDESGKLDPSSVVGTNEASGAGGTRTGDSVREIQLGDVPNLPSWANAFREQSDGGLMPNNGRWLSIEHIGRMFDANGAIVDQSAVYDRLVPAIRPYAEMDRESWRNTGTGPGAGEYHKCDLRAAVRNWDTADITDVPTAAEAYSGGDADAAGSPHLAAVISHLSGTHGLATGNQFRANIIDFFDTDGASSITTNDYDGTTATYVGLEKTPYINEALFRASYESRELRIEPVPGVFVHVGDLAVLRVQVQPELINMYAESLPDAASTITLEFTFEFTLVTTVGSHSYNNPATYPWLKATKTWPLATNAMGANSYEVLGWQDVFAGPSYRRILGALANEQPRITDFKVTEVRVASSVGAPSADTLQDFADLPAQASGYSWTWGPLNVEKEIEFSAEVEDPRVNTLPGEWQWSDFRTSPWTGSDAPTPGDRNQRAKEALSTASADKDSESSTDPANLSTAFILNGDPDCLWQLGAIHRARPWQTLNLHKTDLSQSPGSYEYGDWPLLNQVRLDSWTTERGRVSVYSTVPEVWKAVVRHVHLGADYDDPYGTGTPINSADAEAIAGLTADGIAPRNRDRLDNSNVVSSTDVAWGPGGLVQVELDEILDAAGISVDDDRQKEELLGKIVSLLSDRHNYFTVLVCARAVRDLGDVAHLVGGPQDPGNWFQYEPGKYYAVQAEQKILADVYRDVYTNSFQVMRVKYLEE